MKKTITTSIFVAVLGFTALAANAKSWRINNDATKKADFADLNAAMSSTDVEAGDTLYLDPGCNISGDQTVTKRVTIVGSGYFHTDTPHRFSYITGKLYLKAQYIKVEGVIMTTITHLCANYITLERCKTNTIYINENWTTAAAQFAIIRQCYVVNIKGGSPANSSSDNERLKTAFATIENCILRINNNNTIESLYSPTIRNCYISYTGTGTSSYLFENLDNATITNNIMINKSDKTHIFSRVTNSTVSHNVMSCAESTYAGYAASNQFLDSNDESLVFKMEGTNDQLYQLKDDSPAKNYGLDGTDCGPFGGLYPYVLNGQPAGYPYYTKANIATRAKDGRINVSLNIKMQNE